MTFEEYNAIGTAALVTRSTHDTGTISWVTALLCTNIVPIPVLFLGGVTLALQKDVILSLILLAFVPLVIWIVFWVADGLHGLYQTADHYIDIQNDRMRERLHGIRVIRAFNREQQMQDGIADATHVMAENIIRANLRMAIINPVAILLLNTAAVLIIWVGAFRIDIGVSVVSGGDIFAILQYIALVANGLVMASFAIASLPHARVAANRIGEIFEANGMSELNPEENLVFQGGITFDGVTFRYENAVEPAIRDISFSIEPGQTVAIIGGTGSGKSTLLQMLLAFRLPTQGRVLFDGIPADTINRQVIRDNISCVLQRTAVYSGTIRHNIEMGRPGASEAEILEAASIAQLSDYIHSVPAGLDHVLEQSGKNLSGGQKQRLCIARAVLKNAPIYVFDDSFSALDFLTEARLRKQLSRKIQGKTQIIITQRVTSAMHADQILVMDRGNLIDCGTHDELLSRCTIYQEIYASQTGGGTP